MNITILVPSYPPVLNSASRLYAELAESLYDMGHGVSVITIHPGENDMVDGTRICSSSRASHEIYNNVRVYRIPHLSFMSKIPGGKPIRFFLTCFLIVLRAFFVKRSDVILAYSPPLYMGFSAHFLSVFHKNSFVFNMQDIHPKVLFDSGVIRNRFIKRMLSSMESIIYRNAGAIVVYSPGNREYLLNKGVVNNVFIIPNWVDSTAMSLYNKRQNKHRKTNFIGKFVVSYAGTIDHAQGLEIILNAALILKEYEDIVFILAGEGPAKKDLQKAVDENGLVNVHLLPVMPKEEYVQFLFSSDVNLMPLSKDTPLQTVPGKLPDLLASGRPIIAAVQPAGDAAGIINAAECGLCIHPGDFEGLVQAVMLLYKDNDKRESMGDKARVFAEHKYAREVCTKQYIEVLELASKFNPM